MLRRLSSSIKSRRKPGRDDQNGTATDGVRTTSTSNTSNGTNLAAHGNITAPSPSDANGSSTIKKNRRQSWMMSRQKSSTIPESGELLEGGPVKEDHAANDDDNNIFEQFSSVLQAAVRPLPTQTGDGTYIEKDGSTGIMEDLKYLGFKDFKTLKEVVQQKATNSLVDDKTYFMERVIQLVSALPTHSKKRIELTDAFIDQLWTSLQHPPLSYLGEQYNYRSGDGRYIRLVHYLRRIC